MDPVGASNEPDSLREADVDPGPTARFARAFERSGGEVVEFADPGAAAIWAQAFERDFGSAAQSPLLPEVLRLSLPDAPAESAPLGVSWALGAAAACGSTVLTSREGRHLQILPPSHLIWVSADRVRDRLSTALSEVRTELRSSLAIHSGPSKSADIGRIVVTGVHGPARVVVGIVHGMKSGDPSEPIGSRDPAYPEQA